MRAGQLRQRIEIEQSDQGGLDDFGQPRDGPILFARRWAALEPLAGRELFAAQQVQPEVSYRVRLRYMSGVKPAMRIRLGARRFEIESAVNVGERKRELELLCRELV